MPHIIRQQTLICIALEWKFFMLFPGAFSIVCVIGTKYVCVGTGWISTGGLIWWCHSGSCRYVPQSSSVFKLQFTYSLKKKKIRHFSFQNILPFLIIHSPVFCVVDIKLLFSVFVQCVLFYTIAHHLRLFHVDDLFFFLSHLFHLHLHTCQKYKVGKDEWVRIKDRIKNNHFNRVFY